MLLLSQFICGITALIIACFILKNRKPKGYAKGALSFPFIGHFPYFRGYSEKGRSHLYSMWSKKYGPIVRVDLASQPAVVLHGHKLIREAWNLPEFCGKFRLPAILYRMGNDGKQRGIVFNDGQHWAEQRRFTLRLLKDFGVGKNTMESLILDEAVELVRGLEAENELPVSTQTRFNAATINAVWTIVAGERFKHDDPKLSELVECVMTSLSGTGSLGVLIFMPTLAKMFPRLTGWNDYLEAQRVTREFILKYVKFRLETHEVGCINDFTAAYIEQVNSTTDLTSSFYKEEGIKSLVATLDDLFTAGGETSSTTLSWLCMILALHPHIQNELQREIDSVVGSSRLPSLSDRPRMVFTEAVIQECLRFSAIVTTGLIHYSLKDTVFHDVFIPAGTMLVPNLYAAQHDAEYWGDPEVFRPERFLSDDRQGLIRHEALLAFSAGKRVCPGENLARNELFLISVCLFQKFNIIPDPSQPPPTLKQKVNGVVAKTQPHKLVFLKRGAVEL